jgi:hypothetical protein
MGKKEGKAESERKGLKNRKIAVIMIIIILLQVGFIAIWYVYFRPWTIREVAEATDLNLEGEREDFYNPHGTRVNPSFSQDLVGQKKTVKGHVTDIATYITPIGPLTYYELDDFKVIHLIEWNMPRYKVGNEIEKKVSFEWCRWNEERIVCSPQLDFPVVGGGYLIQRDIDYSSRQDGMILTANQTGTVGEINVSVTLSRREGFPLALFNCSLRRGRFGSGSDYSDACGRRYRENPIVDSISSLTNVSGENNTIHFSDVNQNGLLDDGDYFTFNVAIPEEDNDLLTYLFSINDELWGSREQALYGKCFIIMTNRGLLTRLSCLASRYKKPPYLSTRVMDEEERPIGITTRIIIDNVINEPPRLTDSYFSLYDPYVSWVELFDGEIRHVGGKRIIFSDANANGLLDTGDIFTITGLENRTENYFDLRWIEQEDGQVVRGGYCSHLKWTIGIGMDTGNLPVIHFNGQNITDQNTTFIIEIERMYGVPGLNLSEDFYRWFRIQLEKDDQEILTATNLTADFNVTSDEFNLTFLDINANEFINTGDGFLFEGEPGSYRLILDYVQEEWEGDEEIRILLSQSFSFTI